MGMLTTFTVYNDGIDNILKHPLDLAETIHNACSGTITDKQVPLGCHANMITVQKPRHANSSTLYWHHGNIVQDINEIPDSQVENAIQELEYHIRRLKKLKE
jgi:hypothetical protein